MIDFISDKFSPYVYMGLHRYTGEFYIGYRASKRCNLPSILDLKKYKTSSNYVKPIFDEFDWHIVAEFFDGKDAHDFEQSLIYENWNNPLLLNKVCHYGSKLIFSRVGTTMSSKSIEKRNKTIKNNGGIIISEQHKQKLSDSISRCWKIISPDGQDFFIKNLSKFCKKYNLNVSKMVSVSKGKSDHHKKWKCFKLNFDNSIQNFDKVSASINRSKYRLISPDGTEYITDNLKSFSEDKKLDRSALYKIISGIYTHYKGWKCERL